MGPLGFPLPNVQNNQNYNQYNQNQGNYQAPNNQGRRQNINQGNNNYQVSNYQDQVEPSNELTNYMKSNEATLQAMQTQISNMKTELRNEFQSTIDTRTNKIENQNNHIMNMLTNLSKQKQNTSGSGSLPSNTVANPRGDIKAITTRSGVSYDGPMIPPTPSPLLKEVERKTEVIKDKLDFDTSFADALLYMPKFASTFKSLLSNKEKLFELASNLLNENCSVMLLKKLPKKHGDPSKFLIPCNFPELEECLALADLGASINLMPLSVWKMLSLPELTSNRMNLELANQSVAIPIGVAEDVFVKVGKFYFLAEFVVVDYDVNPRVSLILSSKSGNPNPSDPIISSSSPSFTPLEGGDFFLEEIETCLRSPNELSNLKDDDFDPKGDIALIEKLLNEDPYLNLPSMKNEDLKQVDVTMTKPSIEKPPEL
uniref:Reverse transcriptase domain-containing protein n=1 Tax=Tanacetum cinerariifolium TaxID=118510 RepID=A0A6L2MJ70_TANCI|nr:reverse transcriptase domain-containing protein [Tanacetum cinerariifolium]